MGEIRAFRGLRFTEEAGEFGGLLSPPSERVSPESRERLAAEPNNIVHASLPPSDPDDRSKFVRYARASAQLSGWRRAGVLKRDEMPSLYRLAPPARPDAATWFALVALASLTGSEPAPVKAREDRLRTLEAIRTYAEPVRLTTVSIDRPDVAALPLAKFTHEGEAYHLEAITAPDAIARVVATLAALELHANADPAIDAARAFREAKGDRPDPIAEDYLFAALGPEVAATPSGLLLWNLGDFA